MKKGSKAMKTTCLLMAACILVLAACGKKAPDEIDFGVVENSVYRNDYLGFRITLPSDWSIQDRAMQKKLADAGGKLLAGDDKNLKAAVKAAELQTVNLLAAFRHPMGAPVKFNPNVICIAERVSHLPGIKSGKDYHFHTRRVLEAGQMKISFPRDISTEILGGRSFDVMYAEISAVNLVIRQKYYASIIRDYALACAVTFLTPEDESALNAIMGSASF
jgi:hypothetical protein